jgi:hypothetical protein
MVHCMSSRHCTDISDNVAFFFDLACDSQSSKNRSTLLSDCSLGSSNCLIGCRLLNILTSSEVFSRSAMVDFNLSPRPASSSLRNDSNFYVNRIIHVSIYS